MRRPLRPRWPASPEGASGDRGRSGAAEEFPGDGRRLVGLAPQIARDARLVVLGSFPSEASLVVGQYYAHPRNHFWPLLAALLGEDLVALPYERRLQRLHAHGVGLWDVYAECRRRGSLDSAIRDARTNDLASLRRRAPRLRGIAHNGGESARAMRVTRALGLPVYRLPSTSPANASWSFDRKLAAWREAFADCGIVAAESRPVRRDHPGAGE